MSARTAELVRAGPATYCGLAQRLDGNQLDVINAALLDPLRRSMRAGSGVLALRGGTGDAEKGP